MPIKVIERDAVMLKVAALNGDGVELRLQADDQRIEHRLRLSEAEARELLRLLHILLEAATRSTS
jgi:hypothetical protein